MMGAFRFTLDGRRIASARIAYGGMAATPKRGDGAEAALVGARSRRSRDLERRASPRIGARFHAARPTCAPPPPIARASPPTCCCKALIEVAGGAAPTRIGELHAAE